MTEHQAIPDEVLGARLAKEDERLCETSEAMSYVTMSRIMLRRLARA